METSLLRKKFLDFFEDEKHGRHKSMLSSSLVPGDPSVLLTTAGMQQFKKYYTEPEMADRDFGTRNVASVQKSFRTSDIDEVGDERHLTFFEMLGNFSFGGYFKKEAIEWAHEFITKEMNLEISYVSVFEGSNVVPKDEESAAIWRGLGVSDIREQGMDDVFWGPTGTSGPCGPTTEIYCKNAAGEDIEIWNIVFNEFFCDGSREALLRGKATLTPLPEKGIDTGMGLERLAMVVQKKNTIFETKLFQPIIAMLGSIATEPSRRIIADHIRGIVFLLGDDVIPSNKDRGYILRRLIRRVIPHMKDRTLQRFIRDEVPTPIVHNLIDLARCIIDQYGDVYPELRQKEPFILRLLREEEERFHRNYENGKKILDKMIGRAKDTGNRVLAGTEIFDLVTTYGFVLEWIKDAAKRYGVDLDLPGFEAVFKKHQEISRAGLEKKFGGHGLLLDTGELKAGDEEGLKKVTRFHTATHLLNAALRNILGPDIQQQGSDITPERTRFDFTFSRKLTDEEKKKIEEWVNDAIARDFKVEYQEMPYDEAVASGAIRFWRDKYPSRVKVYSIFDPKTGETISKEFCGGPHVSHTGEIGHFRIAKEESSSAGIRRIRGVID